VATITKLGITVGDPTGIGPEIVAAAVAALPREWLARILVYGDRGPLERGARAMGVELPAELVVTGDGTGEAAEPGRPDERSGAAQVGYLEAAIAAARRGEFAAIATAPISKTWARRAGLAFPGHTELLAARFGADHVVMLFAGPRLKVALATIHVPLAAVAATLTTRGLRRTIEVVAQALVRDFGIAAPRIGVVGLNPHAGEGGLLGTEDDAIIRPALEPPDVLDTGARLAGPIVPDVAFRELLDGKHDAAIAMYHDQGLIPVKLVDFEDSVNVTLGLPIVRTSPDHGTAYDLAGTGKARFTSFACALELAAALVDRRFR
jgi:4-hydroxythreonine-4-phosphate dehydrogenase